MGIFVQLRRLTTDVKNPRADRRFVRRFNAEAIWTAGTILRVTRIPTHDLGSSEDQEDIGWPHGYPMYAIRSPDPRFKLLMDASVEVPLDSFDMIHTAYFGDEDFHCRVVLKALVAQGKVSLEDVVALLKRHDDLYEEVGEGEDS